MEIKICGHQATRGNLFCIHFIAIQHIGKYKSILKFYIYKGIKDLVLPTVVLYMIEM